MRARVYLVSHPEYGDILKLDESIAAARKWAAGLGAGAVVARQPRHCASCDCAPCCCKANGGAA